jgi:hypothetical protein
VNTVMNHHVECLSSYARRGQLHEVSHWLNYIASNDGMMDEWWTNNNSEGSVHGVIRFYPGIRLKSWEKPRKTKRRWPVSRPRNSRIRVHTFTTVPLRNLSLSILPTSHDVRKGRRQSG